jgi:hypothetical protein
MRELDQTERATKVKLHCHSRRLNRTGPRSAVLIQCVSVMRSEQQMMAWTGAYSAALTGFLSSETFTVNVFSKEYVQTVAEHCRALAGQAAEDAQRYWEEGSRE